MMTPFKMPNTKPASRSQLERRANKHGLTIRKFKRGEELYTLVNREINAVIGAYPLTLEEVEQRLDELDNAAE